MHWYIIRIEKFFKFNNIIFRRILFTGIGLYSYSVYSLKQMPDVDSTLLLLFAMLYVATYITEYSCLLIYITKVVCYLFCTKNR